jgi:hypothetical protein
MSAKWPHPGLGHVPSYQSSAQPFLTSSLNVPISTSEPIKVTFEGVTRFIVVTNTVSDPINVPLRFGFSSNGVKGVENNNYLVLNNGESFEAEYRVTDIFLLSDSSIYASSASIAAGITDIPRKFLVNNWSGSSGIG